MTESYSKNFRNTNTEINNAIAIIQKEYSFELYTRLHIDNGEMKVVIEGSRTFAQDFFNRLHEVLNNVI